MNVRNVIDDLTSAARPRFLRAMPLVLILLAALGVRAMVYTRLPVPVSSPSRNLTLYHQALTEHLGEYLSVTTLKPPLSYLIHAAVFRAGPPTIVYGLYLPMLAVFIMDCAAAALLYLACRRLRISRWLAAAVLIVYSVGYIPFELWWDGAHYDHHTLFFTSLLLYCAVRAWTCRSVGNLVMVSAAAGLLVAQSTVNAMSVPAAAVLLALLVSSRAKRRWLGFLRDAALVTLGPVLVLGGLCAKNYYAAGVFGTSNLAGPAAMMIVQKSFDHQHHRESERLRARAEIRAFATECGAPDWYLWAYDNAPPRITPEGKVYGWFDINKAFGICYPEAEAGSGMWPHDYRPLREKLIEFGRPDLAAVVDQDIADARQRPHLFAGFSPELSPRWIGRYGEVSTRIFRTLVTERPGQYLAAVRDCHRIYHDFGSRLPKHLLRPQSRTLPSIPLEGFLRKAARGFELLTSWAYPMAFLGWLCPPAGWLVECLLRRYRILTAPLGPNPMRWFGPFAFLTAAALLMTAVFISMVGAENSRYFMQTAPYFIVVGLLCVSALVVRGLQLYAALGEPRGWPGTGPADENESD